MSSQNFFAELKRRNVYKVAVAYAVVGWLLVQVATQVFPFFEIPNWAVRLIVLVIVIGFPIALVLAWAFELTPEGIKRTEDGAVPPRSRGRAWIYVVVVGAVLSIGLFFLGRYSGRTVTAASLSDKSIAVLPFVDLSQAKDQEYFCDGISEEILDALSKVEGLRVVARTSSFSFKGKNVDVAEIGQKLGVADVLEGSLRREGNRIRITAQLVNARNGFHIWSDTFERELQGVFSVQDEITRAIVEALKIKLAVAPPVPPVYDTEAHDLYLQGLFFANKSDESSLRKALDLFQRSIEKDPSSSLAWTGVARVWDWLADAYVRPLDAYPQVKSAAAKAISLNEQNAEAHCWLGDAIHVLDWDLAGNERELRRALEIDPNSALAHRNFAIARSFKGDWEGAVDDVRQAMKLDPLSAATANGAVLPYLKSHRTNEAIAAAKRVSELDPTYLYFDPPLCVIYLETGRNEEAVNLYRKAEEVTGTPLPGLAVAYARMGRAQDARLILDELLDRARTHYIAASPIAWIYAALGDKEEAFRWLERAYTEHDATIYRSPTDFGLLQSDPRFPDLLRRIGLQPQEVLAPSKNK